MRVQHDGSRAFIVVFEKSLDAESDNPEIHESLQAHSEALDPKYTSGTVCIAMKPSDTTLDATLEQPISIFKRHLRAHRQIHLIYKGDKTKHEQYLLKANARYHQLQIVHELSLMTMDDSRVMGIELDHQLQLWYHSVPASFRYPEPTFLQRFELEDGTPLESLESHQFSNSSRRYVLWEDILHTFENLVGLRVKFPDGAIHRVLLLVDSKHKLYVESTFFY